MAKGNNNPTTPYPLPWTYPIEMTFDMLYQHYFNFILRDVFNIFIFDGLPETISETFLKYTLFLNGKVIFFELDDTRELVALNGTYSDRQDIYYVPDKMIVSNPRLTKSYLMQRDVDCVVVYCSETDVYNQIGTYGGLYSLIAKTATMLADNDLSINVAQKNTRLINIVAAEDQNTKESVDIIIKKQYSGEPYAAVMKSMIDTVQSIPLVEKTNGQYLVQLVELHQYILSHFYEAIGLTTHDNMKKERLISDEVNDNDSLSKLNVNNMLDTIQKGLDKVNTKYGTEIYIRLNPLLEGADQTADETSEDQTADETSEDQTADETSEDQTADETSEDQTADETSEDQTADETSEDQTADETSEDQTADETSEDQTADETSEDQSTDEELEQKIEINITVQDDAIADIVIDNGGDQDGLRERVPNMDADNGDDD